jgi:hypothetical protein
MISSKIVFGRESKATSYCLFQFSCASFSTTTNYLFVILGLNKQERAAANFLDHITSFQ